MCCSQEVQESNFERDRLLIMERDIIRSLINLNYLFSNNDRPVWNIDWNTDYISVITDYSWNIDYLSIIIDYRRNIDYLKYRLNKGVGLRLMCRYCFNIFKCLRSVN